MPGTGDLIAAQLPFPQRAAVVRANIVDAVEFSRHVKQHDQPVVHLQQLLARIGKVGNAGDFDELRHGYWYSRTRRAMARPRALRTLSMVIRSKTCWKKPVT